MFGGLGGFPGFGGLGGLRGFDDDENEGGWPFGGVPQQRRAQPAGSDPFGYLLGGRQPEPYDRHTDPRLAQLRQLQQQQGRQPRAQPRIRAAPQQPAQPQGPVPIRAFAKESPTHFFFFFEVPGVREEDIKVQLVGRETKLRVQASRTELRRTPWGEAFRVRVPMETTVELPTGVQTEQIEAQVDGGVLTVSLEKAAAPEEREIREVPLTGRGNAFKEGMRGNHAPITPVNHPVGVYGPRGSFQAARDRDRMALDEDDDEEEEEEESTGPAYTMPRVQLPQQRPPPQQMPRQPRPVFPDLPPAGFRAEQPQKPAPKRKAEAQPAPAPAPAPPSGSPETPEPLRPVDAGPGPSDGETAQPEQKQDAGSSAAAPTEVPACVQGVRQAKVRREDGDGKRQELPTPTARMRQQMEQQQRELQEAAERAEQEKTEALERVDREKQLVEALHKLTMVQIEVDKIRNEHEEAAFKLAPGKAEEDAEKARTKYEELLLKQMLELDSIQTGGVDMLRRQRKVLVCHVQRLLDALDAHVKAERELAEKMDKDGDGVEEPNTPFDKVRSNLKDTLETAHRDGGYDFNDDDDLLVRNALDQLKQRQRSKQ
eukprot:TRINITY_DN7639_c0_g1_i3.p2 TRINITY_DN7639_c0_g1~~TRINITY_DN7639_c0_g1_i3.p2  ORF type:complete len:630 (+),score=254.72 TRINITY_DN7639_c0_g1_i3:97-1890(+)